MAFNVGFLQNMALNLVLLLLSLFLGCNGSPLAPKFPLQPDQRPAPQPTVYIVAEGYHRELNQDPYTSQASGSVTLVQSNGVNILVDSGTATNADTISNNLKSLLVGGEIQMTFITHTHPDHYENVLRFSKVQNWWTFSVTGDQFTANPLNVDKPYFLFNDTNLEVWKTPGHTNQDCSLLVHNWNNTNTTLGIVGDLFFNCNDTMDPSLWTSGSADIRVQTENRRRVACTADFVVPGHGAMFPITKKMKTDYFNCFNASVNLTSSSFLVFLFVMCFSCSISYFNVLF